MKINFTENQNEFINCPDKNIFLNACPGAGKTKAVVARYIKRAEELSRNFGRRSIAVLSFTNVAINEISDRCLKNNQPFLLHYQNNQPFLLHYPNYVGTFDSFLNRYFFRQLVNHPLKKPISVVESWDAVGAAVSCEHGSIPLSNFIFCGNSISLKQTQDFGVNRSYRKDPERWNYLAKKLRQQCFSYGIISAEEVRNFIFPKLVKDDKIFNSISKRFEEIIIDEIQDCNEQDLFILKKARDFGCNVVMVGDLDQSIYRFRNVSLSKIETYISTHKPIRLTDNFRSTKIICELYSTLRKSNIVDNSTAEHADLNIPIGLIFYNTLNKEITEKFTFSFGSFDEPIRNYKILSYQEGTARRASGEKVKKIGNSLCEKLATNINLFINENSTPKQKKQAIIFVEYILLRLLDQDISHYSTESYCKQKNLNYRWLKRCALQVLNNAPPPPYRKNYVVNWLEKIKDQLSELPTPANKMLNWKAPGLILKKPKRWSISDYSDSTSVSSTIHGVKGEEFDAVLVVINDDDRSDTLFENWKSRQIGEAERVMYVACSRAKKYLCIAVPDKNKGAFLEILKDKDISFNILSEE